MLYVKKRKEVRGDVVITCYDVYITRGDSGYLDITMTDKDGNPIELTSEDSVRCQVRDSDQDTAQLIFEGKIEVNSEGVHMLHVYPEDTADVELGNYVYDIEVDTAGGDVFTIIPLSYFILLPESTRKEEENGD